MSTRRFCRLAASGLLLFAAGGCLPRPGSASRPLFEAPLEKAIFEAVNRERVRAGMLPLRWSRDLHWVARDHTAEMIRSGALTHSGEGGTLVQERFDRAGVDWVEAGENVARNRGFADPAAEAVRGWLASPPHRANIFSPRFAETAVGAAVSADGGYYYITQVFLLRMPE